MKLYVFVFVFSVFVYLSVYLGFDVDIPSLILVLYYATYGRKSQEKFFVWVIFPSHF